MTDGTASWEKRISGVWADIDDYEETAFVTLIDSTGHSDQAVPLYRAALEAGLEGERRRRAVIQMASSLRNLGNAHDAVALLTAELDVGSDDLTSAVRAFLALALVDMGREREAVAVALTALEPYLPRYNRSVARYAQQLKAEVR